MDTSVLEDIGLTRAQIKVYVALLELGETTTGPLIKKTGLQNSVVYNALNQLIKNGLVTFILKGKRKYFSATHPKHLMKYVDDKKERLKDILPLLIHKQKEDLPVEAQVFTGWKGIFAAFNDIIETLPKGSEYIAFGVGFEEQYTPEAVRFFEQYQLKRASMKYKIRIIINESARKQMKNYQWHQQKNPPQVRHVEGFALVGVIIYANSVLNVAFEKDQPPVAVRTTSTLIANSYRRAFESMWKIGKK